MKCKNCKHWDMVDFIANDLKLPKDDTGQCQVHSPDWRKGYNDNVAMAICYGSGTDGEFITRGEFGCVSFEAYPHD